MTLDLVPLQRLCLKVNTWNPQVEAPNEMFDYIDIASIDRDEKQITAAVRNVGRDAPSRARQMVQAEDVLVSTVRPNLNAVAVVPLSMAGATASTGFTVLRADPKKLYFGYLFHWVKHPRFVAEMTSRATGASYPAITDGIVKTSCIPLLPLAEQKRLAGILDEANALRRKRSEAIAKLDFLMQSVFLEMFGDPVTNPKGWKVATLSELGNLERGKSKHRPRNAPELYGGSHPFIQTGDIANAKDYITEFRQTYSDAGLKQSRLWQKGTLCITIAANIAMTAVLEFDGCFPDSVVGFVPNHRSTVEYIHVWFKFMQAYLESIAPESAQKNINLEILRALPIQEPPIERQNDFTAAFINLITLRATMSEAAEKEGRLFNTLQYQAFSSSFNGTTAEKLSIQPCLTLDF